jgi:hypothetical protein
MIWLCYLNSPRIIDIFFLKMGQEATMSSKIQ